MPGASGADGPGSVVDTANTALVRVASVQEQCEKLRAEMAEDDPRRPQVDDVISQMDRLLTGGPMLRDALQALGIRGTDSKEGSRG